MAKWTRCVRCSVRVSRSAATAALIVSSVLIFFIGSIAVADVAAAADLSRRGVAGILTWLSVLSVVIAYLLARQTYSRFRWRFVIDDGTNCLNCNYNLTGLTEPRCPECGQPFEPKGDAP